MLIEVGKFVALSFNWLPLGKVLINLLENDVFMFRFCHHLLQRYISAYLHNYFEKLFPIFLRPENGWILLIVTVVTRIAVTSGVVLKERHWKGWTLYPAVHFYFFPDRWSAIIISPLALILFLCFKTRLLLSMLTFEWLFGLISKLLDLRHQSIIRDLFPRDYALITWYCWECFYYWGLRHYCDLLCRFVVLIF